MPFIHIMFHFNLTFFIHTMRVFEYTVLISHFFIHTMRFFEHTVYLSQMFILNMQFIYTMCSPEQSAYPYHVFTSHKQSIHSLNSFVLNTYPKLVFTLHTKSSHAMSSLWTQLLSIPRICSFLPLSLTISCVPILTHLQSISCAYPLFMFTFHHTIYPYPRLILPLSHNLKTLCVQLHGKGQTLNTIPI